MKELMKKLLSYAVPLGIMALAVLVAAVLIMLAAPGIALPGLSAQETIQGGTPVRVENIFVDMNGDGKLDLVVTGEVIYNATR